MILIACMNVLSHIEQLLFILTVELTTVLKESCQRKLNSCVFMICRHTLHLGIMAFMTDTSDATQSRIFTGWSVFELHFLIR